MKEVGYQLKYIKKVADTATESLEDKFQEGSTIVFQAPTGSGKTYMISQALTQIVKRSKKSFALIWISVNSLHEQSRQNLSRYFDDEKLLECISIEEIANNTIEGNEIVFFNWDSLIKENNVFRMDNERDWNLESIVANTKEEGREIILIIDESHRTARAIKAQDVIKVIAPILTIEVTATPKEIRGTTIKIPITEVIAEGMIKMEVRINPESHHIKENKELLEVALKKRKQLKNAYDNIGSEINPLLLIQIPNKKASDSTNPEDYIVGLLADCNITISNKKLAIWLSDKKENKELVEADNSDVDVLIFKEAIALGWDCPRAAVLFLQREWKEERFSFNIQTLGRIMRMPEQKHYDEKPELNVGYVYSASNNFSIIEDLASDYVSQLEMIRDENLYSKRVQLYSEFIRRKSELTRLSGDFKQCLFKAAFECKVKDNININIKEITKSIALEGRVTDITDVEEVKDNMTERRKRKVVKFQDRKDIKKDIQEIADSYSNFCGDMSSPYAKARSAQIIKSSLRTWFKETFSITDENTISLIVVHRNNIKTFKSLLERAKELYQQLPIKSEEVVITPDWEVPSDISIFADFEPVIKSKRSIIKEEEEKKLFVKLNKNGDVELSKPELKFIEALENCDAELQWWFKNSYGKSKYFSIAYQKPNKHYYGFYPDFILKTKKETLIVEIKDDKDFKAENAMKLRAGQDYLKKYKHNEALRFYILSPDDYENFFHLLQEQDLVKFKSIYEERLLRYQKSNLLILEKKKDPTEKEKFELELLEELDKTIDELKDIKLKNELLELSLQQAEKNFKVIVKPVVEKKTESKGKIKIPVPFNICVLGEVSDEEKVTRDLQKYFTKQGIDTNDWDINFFSNAKLQNSDVLRSLIKNQSRYNLIVTGQIHHHSGKGNKKANIISELKNEKYIPHKIGSDPKDLLTPDKMLKTVHEFFST